MSAELFVASHIRVAAEDLEGALALVKLGNRNAVYLCSQAAEKLVKAILTTENLHGGREHRLDVLIDKIPDENPLKPDLRKFQRISDFSTTFRYPTIRGKVKEQPDSDALAETIDLVQAAIAKVAERLEISIPDKGAPAGNIDPIRT
ncbi:MAG: HEPN domain-containing protein [Planctomycetota bacterium]|nr:HEPN domain-containing protein [Planctomycetota bacterium]